MFKSSHFKFISYFCSAMIFGLAVLVLGGCSKKSASSRQNEVVVYTYDSFVSEWGPGPEIEKAFEHLTVETLSVEELIRKGLILLSNK